MIASQRANTSQDAISRHLAVLPMLYYLNCCSNRNTGAVWTFCPLSIHLTDVHDILRRFTGTERTLITADVAIASGDVAFSGWKDFNRDRLEELSYRHERSAIAIAAHE